MIKLNLVYLSKKATLNAKNKIFQQKDKMPTKRLEAYTELDDETAKLHNIISYLLLKKILTDNNIEVDESSYNYSKDGKPYYENSNINFSISHSEDMIAVAIDDNELGIDVEKIKEVKNNIIDRVYSKEEQKLYSEKLLDDSFFCKTWTKKESFAKSSGKGMNIDFDSITLDLESDFNEIKDYYINTIKLKDAYLSICGKTKEYDINEINIEQLFD